VWFYTTNDIQTLNLLFTIKSKSSCQGRKDYWVAVCYRHKMSAYTMIKNTSDWSLTLWIKFFFKPRSSWCSYLWFNMVMMSYKSLPRLYTEAAHSISFNYTMYLVFCVHSMPAQISWFLLELLALQTRKYNTWHGCHSNLFHLFVLYELTQFNGVVDPWINFHPYPLHWVILEGP